MNVQRHLLIGEAGIRTLGALTGSTVFETAPFDRSGTSPRLNIEKVSILGKSIVTGYRAGVPHPDLKGRDRNPIVTIQPDK